jgi:hypothetical protein
MLKHFQYGDPLFRTAWIGVARDSSHDMLFFGGDSQRDAVVAYGREVTPTAFPTDFRHTRQPRTVIDDVAK